MAEGISILFDEDLINKVELVDKSIEDLAKNSDKAADKIAKAFQEVANGGLKSVLSKLEEVQSAIDKIGKGKVFNNVSEQAEGAADDINALVEALNMLVEEMQDKKKIPSLKIVKSDEEKKRIAELKQEISSINKELNKGGKEGKPLTLSAQQELVNKRQALKEELKLQQTADAQKDASRLKEISKQKSAYAKQLALQKEFAAKSAQIEKENAERIAKIQSDLRRSNYQSYIQGYEGSLRYSKKALDKGSMNQNIIAIKNLQAARDNLSRSTKDYDTKVKQLNATIEKHKAIIDQVKGKTKQLQIQQSTLTNTADQLGRKLALLFSVSAMTGYVSKLVKIRGEFELQQRSLQAILQNKDQANKIFNQITQLAVQSPFQLRELVTYTKQLAAYRIETSKLYDTTKMLADISAGVGVDMSRLVLAYGQVSSANYLRGTELRQFSEAGINVLGGLAEYFTELKGRVVGVDEVFDMVSKRMVMFEDVEEVLRRMTAEGGDFYNMQAIQAQTLKGMVSNLKDSYEIMLNEIGVASEDSLKGAVGAIKTLVDNWRSVLTVLELISASTAFVFLNKFRKGLLLTGDALIEAANAGRGFAGVAARLKVAIKSLTAAISSHPFVAIATAVAAASLAIYNHAKAVDEANKKYDENSVAILNSQKGIDKIASDIAKVNKEITDAETVIQDTKTSTDDLTDAENKANIARETNLGLLKKLKSEYPEVYEKMVLNANGTVDLKEAVEEYNKTLLTNIALQQLMKGGFFKADVGKETEKAEEAFTKYQTAFNKFKAAVVIDYAKMDRELQEELKEPFERLGDSKDYATLIVRYSEMLRKVRKWQEKNHVSINPFPETEKMRSDLGKASMAYQEELKDLQQSTERMIPTLKLQWEQLGYDMTTELGKANAKNWANNFLNMLGQMSGKFRTDMQKWLNKSLNLNIDFGFNSNEQGNGNNKNASLTWVERTKDDIAKLKKQMPVVTSSLKELQEGLTFDLKLPDNNTSYDKYVKDIIATDEKIKSALEKSNKAGQKIINDQEKQRLQAASNLYEQIKSILGIGKDKQDKGSQESLFSQQLQVIKDVYKEYEKLRRTFSDETALQKVISDYEHAFDKAFKGIKKNGQQATIEMLDFTDNKGIIDSFNWLENITQETADKIRVQLEKNKLNLDFEISTKESNDKAILKEFENLFGNYEISLQLEKLGISPEAAKQLMGIDSKSLDQIKSELEARKDEFTGKNMLEEYSNLMSKIDDAIEKEQQERLKKYLAYARDAVSERAKIKLEEMKKLQEIEETFAVEENDTPVVKKQKTIAKEKASSKVKTDAASEMQKFEWGEFQKSDTFIQLFDDLDHASSALVNHTIKQLQNFKDQWTDLPLEEMEKIVGKIDELQNKIIENDPFVSYRQSIEEIRDAIKNTDFQSPVAAELAQKGGNNNYANALDAENILQETQKKNADERIAQIEAIIRLKEEGNQMDIDSLDLSEEEYDLLQMTSDEINKELSIYKTISSQSSKKINDNNKTKKLIDKQNKSLKEEAKALKKIQGLANDLYGAFKGLYDVLGGDEVVAIFADMGMEMMNTVMNTIVLQQEVNAVKTALDTATVGATAFGAALNSAMGIIGWIVMAVQLITAALKAIFGAKQKRLEEQVDAAKRKVDELKKSYDKLAESIKKAYTMTDLQEQTAAAEDNFQQMLAAQDEAIAAQEQMKHADEEGSDEWKELQEMREEREKMIEEHEELENEVHQIVTNVFDDLRDSADGFVDAWYEAFQETGDGLSGLEEEFKNLFTSIIKRQASLIIVGDYIKKWESELRKYVNEEDLVFDPNEAEKYVNTIKADMPNLNENLKNYFEQFEKLFPKELEVGDTLSGLQEGIQGITEETAQIIEAYLNSIRFTINDTNMKFTGLIGGKLDEYFNPMIEQLRLIAIQTADIDDLLNSVHSPHPNGGFGIKVIV